MADEFQSQFPRAHLKDDWLSAMCAIVRKLQEWNCFAHLDATARRLLLIVDFESTDAELALVTKARERFLNRIINFPPDLLPEQRRLLRTLVSRANDAALLRQKELEEKRLETECIARRLELRLEERARQACEATRSEQSAREHVPPTDTFSDTSKKTKKNPTRARDQKRIARIIRAIDTRKAATIREKAAEIALERGETPAAVERAYYRYRPQSKQKKRSS